MSAQHSEFSKAFWTRGLQTAIAANLAPYFFTYQAYQNGGYEVVGWPISFFVQSGGIVGVRHFRLFAFFADVICGVGIVFVVAHFLKDGLSVLLYKIRTWGLQEHSVPPPAKTGQAIPDFSLRISTMLWILSGWCVALGLDRLFQPSLHALLSYGGLLIVGGFLLNKVWIFGIGTATTVATLFISDHFGPLRPFFVP